MAALFAGLLLRHHLLKNPPSLGVVLLLLAFMFCMALWLSLLVSKKTLWRQSTAIPKVEKAALLIFPVVIAASLFIQQTLKYAAFKSQFWDIGCFAQGFANTLSGHFFETTCQFTEKNLCAFGSHTELMFLAAVPFFAAVPHPLTLVAFQSVLIGISLICFHGLALEVTGSRKAALLFMICFGLYPALYLAGLFDFHGDTLALPFLLLLIRRSTGNKLFPTIGWLLLALACKEYIALITLPWGLYCAIKHRRIKLGTTIIAISVLWWIVAGVTQNMIRPSWQPSQFALIYQQWGVGTSAIVNNVLGHPFQAFVFMANPKNIENLLLLSFPHAGLFFLYPWMLFVGGIGIVKELLSGRMSLDNHHLAPLIPFLWYGALKGYMRLKTGFGPRKRATVLLLVFLCSLISSVLYSETPWSQRFYRGFSSKYFVNHADADLVARLKKINSDCAVSVTSNIYPHLFKHEFIYLFPFVGVNRPAQYVIIDARCLLPGSQTSLDSLIKEGKYLRVWNEGSYSMYQKTPGPASDLNPANELQ